MPGKVKISDTLDCSDMFCAGRGVFSKRIEKILIS